MADVVHDVVRIANNTGLEGALRVFLPPESLDQIGLQVGELCEMSTSQDSSICYGIAWRADDRLRNQSKARTAKVSETLQKAFGWKDGTKVTIAPSQRTVTEASSIVISDVSPKEYNYTDASDDGLWVTRVRWLFSNCEALTCGAQFDIAQGKQKSVRRRFAIQRIESPEGSDGLFIYRDKTGVMIAESTSNAAAINGVSKDAQSVDEQDPLPDTRSICGLVQQLKDLNRGMQNFLIDHFYENSCLKRNVRSIYAVLVHGPEGTGKTMLLDCVKRSKGFRAVHEINERLLKGKTAREGQEVVSKVFKAAVQKQPSLIVMDGLDQVTPPENSQVRTAVTDGLDQLRGQRVMVIGAARSLNDIHASLCSSGRFSAFLELDLPDINARAKMLNRLRRLPADANDELSRSIALRTQGFTGGDIVQLNIAAEAYADRRRVESTLKLSSSEAPNNPPSEGKFVETFSCQLRLTTSVHTADRRPETLVPVDTSLEDFEYGLRKVQPTALRGILTEKPLTKWTDIGGSTELKERFDRFIGWPLLHPELLAEFNQSPSKGVLLYGPPGCSKTLTAQAVANSYNMNFIAIKGAELLSMYVGESERAVRDVFRKAKAAAPCVIFFDEIDAIGSKREGGGSTNGLNVLTTLLNEMDGFEVLKDVFILAATNAPERLDPALIRPGRFDSHVYLGPPGKTARKEILSIATGGVPLASDVDLDDIVAATEGYSGAELVKITASAKDSAIQRIFHQGEGASRSLTNEDFQRGRSTTRKGISAEMLQAYEAFGKDFDQSW